MTNRIIHKYSPAQSPGISMFGVRNPAAHRLRHFFMRQVAIAIGLPLFTEAMHETAQIAAAQATVGRKNHESTEINPDTGWEHHAFLWMQEQA
jgi:hypothetical protein